MRVALAFVSLCLVCFGAVDCATLGFEHDGVPIALPQRLPGGASGLSCPPNRRMCLSNRTFRAPPVCETDNDCLDYEKCCTDACVKDFLLCKPGI